MPFSAICELTTIAVWHDDRIAVVRINSRPLKKKCSSVRYESFSFAAAKIYLPESSGTLFASR